MDTYETTKTWLAAILLTYGISHDHIDASNPREVKFIYSNTPELKRAIAAHYSGQLNIPSMLIETCYKQMLDIAKHGK